jgi:oxygen-independent coproporphyrinogen-3 oxidase
MPAADTVYFGGGTPTLLSAEQIGRILDVIEANFSIEKGAEITIETNPKSADGKKLAEIRKVGVDRLSIGMQSVHDNELRALGRIHNFDDFKITFSEAREAGFDNISADLMYGIPDQTRESFIESVRTLAAFEPEHISSYSLTVEEGTNFYRRRDKLIFPDEDTVSDMYADMTEALAKYGYHKYEISNFAKDGRASRHNIKYWRLEDYLGFGAAAHSCFGGKRFAHSRDIEAYLRGESIIIDVEELSKKEQMNEYVMLGMRLAEGIDLDDFKARFNVDFSSEFSSFAKFAPEFIEISEKNCKFTEKGMFVSNYILSDVLDFGE